ncbi:hypothetical protein [Enterococcus casseliflavus]|uniref:hypothetical protein n=1 Tax=Enterococcus casseliflavus TaxID=37734 RepID=UPI000E4D0B3D|nr:hypothetical protein [Enterococcus casseliflavus]RHH54929.1 hypothetical protein DW201_10735 [Enterococcus casseliflavus]
MIKKMEDNTVKSFRDFLSQFDDDVEVFFGTEGINVLIDAKFLEYELSEKGKGTDHSFQSLEFIV